MLPGGTGERIADVVDARGIQPPILYMSGYSEAAVARNDMLANAAGFLEKPFTPSGLLDAVADALVVANSGAAEAGGTRVSRSTRDRPPVK